MKEVSTISLGFGLLISLLNQSCCHQVACDEPPRPSIILIVSLDSLGSGFTSSEFQLLNIIRITSYPNQIQIDTLTKDGWYYEGYTEYPYFPRYELILGGEEGDQNYEFMITDNFTLNYTIDNIYLRFKISKSRCCSFRVLDFMSFNSSGQKNETSEYGYELIIEK